MVAKLYVGIGQLEITLRIFGNSRESGGKQRTGWKGRRGIRDVNYVSTESLVRCVTCTTKGARQQSRQGSSPHSLIVSSFSHPSLGHHKHAEGQLSMLHMCVHELEKMCVVTSISFLCWGVRGRSSGQQ